jgi:hypothetical protein
MVDTWPVGALVDELLQNNVLGPPLAQEIGKHSLLAVVSLDTRSIVRVNYFQEKSGRDNFCFLTWRGWFTHVFIDEFSNSVQLNICRCFYFEITRFRVGVHEFSLVVSGHIDRRGN